MKQYSHSIQSDAQQSNQTAKQSQVLRRKALKHSERLAAKQCRAIQCKAMPSRASQNNAIATQRGWVTRQYQQECMQAIVHKRNTLAKVTGLGGLFCGWWPRVILALSMRAGVRASMRAPTWKICHFAKVDTLGIEPRASRMLSGCDTTTPCARCFSAAMGWNAPT